MHNLQEKRSNPRLSQLCSTTTVGSFTEITANFSIFLQGQTNHSMNI